jgi:hypothetical protein
LEIDFTDLSIAIKTYAKAICSLRQHGTFLLLSIVFGPQAENDRRGGKIRDLRKS